MVNLIEKHNLYCYFAKQLVVYIKYFCESMIINGLYFELSVSSDIDIINMHMT